MGIRYKIKDQCVDIVIDGSLTISEVDCELNNLKAAFKNVKKVKWSFSGITKCDTAGVQLICSSAAYLDAHAIQSELGIPSECIAVAAKEIGVDLQKLFKKNEVSENG